MKTEKRKYISRGRIVTTLPHPMIEKIREMATTNKRTIGAQMEVMIEDTMRREGDMT